MRLDDLACGLPFERDRQLASVREHGSVAQDAPRVLLQIVAEIGVNRLRRRGRLSRVSAKRRHMPSASRKAAIPLTAGRTCRWTRNSRPCRSPCRRRALAFQLPTRARVGRLPVIRATGSATRRRYAAISATTMPVIRSGARSGARPANGEIRPCCCSDKSGWRRSLNDSYRSTQMKLSALSTSPETYRGHFG